MSEDLQDFFLSCKECVLENPRNFYGCFSLGPFQNSQSLTVANALRRTLLSEIRGIAITHVEIEGVVHEYTTLPGVRESVLDILLNFKQIVLKKVMPFSKPLYGYLNVRGPGKIRVSDLRFPPMVQCVDSDQYIATLIENGKLTLKFTIEDFQNSSKNEKIVENFVPFSKFPRKNFQLPNSYVPEGESFLDSSPNIENLKGENFVPGYASKFMTVRKSSRTGSSNFQKPVLLNNNKGKLFEHVPFKHVFPVGKDIHKNGSINFDFNTNGQKKSLWVDPIFNPILKVNYVIENIEPFQKNQPNQLVMIELWTNGSIHPRKALYDAFMYLKIMFEKLDSMKFLNYQLANSIFVSEKTNTKFLQNFENNLTLFRFLETKNSSPILFTSLKTNQKQKFFLSNEMKEMQKHYVLEEKQKSNEMLFLPIEELHLSSRILKSLRRNNFQTINDLIKVTPAILKTYPGIGNFSISQIQKSLAQIGLIWG
uniref:DNA-directed RNA polymerase n=1 Tax=Hariotina sp. MMOGRB0030F TaxID=1867922 RepID=A0A2H4FV87_9CHLO|nr:RNA polymerase alpha subunit [Hariotina sp. MMOGRB0030F]